MKISILTHPPAKNYGGIMQALALSRFLQELGQDCTIIYGPMKKLSFSGKLKVLLDGIIGRDKDRPYRAMMDFIKKYLPVSEPWYGGDLPECDCFVVGSDQVWRPAYTPLPGAYFLDFLPEGSCAKRIAYAASFGVDHWEFTPEQTEQFGELIRRFDAVSVREGSGVTLCREYWQCTASQMPDPTLLHDAVFYRSFVPTEIRKDDSCQTKSLFTYFLDPNPGKDALADSFCSAADLQRLDFLPRGKKAIRRPVEEFICGIDKASFVLTDSFHGMVFSMIFGVPFAVIGNAKRGMTRFELAEKAGVPEALLGETVKTDVLLELYSDPSRYKCIAGFLKNERLRGREFLKRYIS